MRSAPPLATLLLLAFVAGAAPVRAAGNGAPKPFAPGNFLIGLDEAMVIREFAPDGTMIRDIGGGVFTNTPEDIVVGSDGRIYMTQYSPGKVFVFNSDGTYATTFGPGSNLSSARGMALGPRGTLYVASYGNDRIIEFSLYDGSPVREIGVGTIDSPVPLAVGPDGHIYAGSIALKKIYEIDPFGTIVRTIAAASAPHCGGMTIGPDGYLYVTSYQNNAVMRFNSTGTKNGEFSTNGNGATDLTFGADGNIYVMNSFNVEIFNPGGLPKSPPPGGFPTPNHSGGIGVVPAFFDGQISGTLEQDDAPPLKIKQKVRVGYQPNSNVVTFWIDLDPVNPVLTEFIKAFPSLGFTFNGSEAVASPTANKRSFQGSMTLAGAIDQPSAHLQMSFSGKHDAQNTFMPTKGSGQLLISSATKQLRGSVKLKKRLN